MLRQASKPSVGRRLGEEVDHHHPGDDQAHPDQGAAVGDLLVEDRTTHRDQDDPDPGPDRVGDSQRDLVQTQREQVEGEHIADDHDHGRPGAREGVRRLEGTGRDDFGENGEAEKDDVHEGFLQIGPTETPQARTDKARGPKPRHSPVTPAVSGSSKHTQPMMRCRREKCPTGVRPVMSESSNVPQQRDGDARTLPAKQVIEQKKSDGPWRTSLE